MITVEDLKAHLNLPLDSTADDAVLSAYIEAASVWIASFTGGPADDVGAPAPLKQAARQLAGHLFENREATLVGVTSERLPFGVMDLIMPYREWGF